MAGTTPLGTRWSITSTEADVAATVLNVLAKSAEILQRMGWCQDWFAFAYDSEGHRVRCSPESDGAESVCAAGAVHRAMHEMGVEDRVGMYNAVIARLRTTLYNLTGVTHKVPVWNDSWSRSKEQVIALFEVAANDERLGAPLHQEAA